VPARYTENKLLREDGELVLENGLPVLEYKAGDIMYTNTTPPQVILEYQVGDFVIDETTGEPVEVAPRDLQYHWDFIAFDGCYYFTRDEYDLEFAQQTKDFFINVIDKDMKAFSEQALDQTSLMYQPRNKLGYQKVVVNSNYQSYLKQDLTFAVTYYLTATDYKNVSLKDALTASTPKIINEALYGATTIDVAGLSRLLKEAGSGVVSVKLSALAGDSTVDVISNADSLTGFSIRKKLQQSSDGLLSIKEDIDIVFLPHDVSMVNLGPV
jgi:hypothetical protein